MSLHKMGDTSLLEWKKTNAVDLQDTRNLNEKKFCQRDNQGALTEALSVNESDVSFTVEQYSSDELCADDEGAQEKSDSDIDRNCLRKQENEYCFEKEWLMERKCMLYTLLYVRALNRRLKGNIFTVNKQENGQFSITRTDPRFRINVSLMEKEK